MERFGQGGKVSLYKSLDNHLNPEIPRLWPWILRKHTISPPYIFVRNPYFGAVNPQGNQLPYIDQVRFDVKQPNMIPVAASNGEISFQLRHINFSDYTLLMNGTKKRDYSIYPLVPRNTLHPDRIPQHQSGHRSRRSQQRTQTRALERQTLPAGLIPRYQSSGHHQSGVQQPHGASSNRAGAGVPFHHEGLMKSFTQHDPKGPTPFSMKWGSPSGISKDTEPSRTVRP